MYGFFFLGIENHWLRLEHILLYCMAQHIVLSCVYRKMVSVHRLHTHDLFSVNAIATTTFVFSLYLALSCFLSLPRFRPHKYRNNSCYIFFFLISLVANVIFIVFFFTLVVRFTSTENIKHCLDTQVAAAMCVYASRRRLSCYIWL